MSRRPTTEPLSSTTGRWRKWWVIINVRASIAESLMRTQVGSGVMTSATFVKAGLTPLATTLLVISTSVMIPARLLLLRIKAASPRLLASICVTERILSMLSEQSGFLGRNFETGRSSVGPAALEVFFTGREWTLIASLALPPPFTTGADLTL